ncbi:hypothetical protein B0H11DRAFT_2213789 [Mycena galericulata]|nr:hypothetical protein B0H11DRAFT_2213789 [Mycena galericulata]
MPPIRRHFERVVSKYRSAVLGRPDISAPPRTLQPPQQGSEDSDDFRERGPPLRTWIYKDWYTYPTPPAGWSTDWEDFDILDFWDPAHMVDSPVDGRRVLKIERLFQDVFDVPGTVVPLAFVYPVGGEIFLFTAGGRYYLYSDGRVVLHRMEFAGPKEFLEYALEGEAEHISDGELIPMRPGATLDNWYY